MDTSSTYRRLLDYVDELNAGIGQLAITVEQQMAGRGYVPIETAKRQAYWGLNANIDRARRWRVKMVTRMLVPEGCEKTDHSLLYQVLIDSASAFDYPTILCARVEHAPMSPSRIFVKVWQSGRFATLHRKDSRWRDLREEDGWCVARPAYRTAITRLKGYLLNLFEVDSQERVAERMVEPLVRSGDDGWRLDVGQLAFPGLEA